MLFVQHRRCLVALTLACLLAHTMDLLHASSSEIRPTLIPIAAHKNLISAVAFSSDGALAVTGGEDGTVKLWDIGNGRLVRTFTGHFDPILSVALSFDGTHVLSGSRDKTLRVWDSKSGDLLHTLSGHRGGVTSVAFSRDAAFVVSGSVDQTVRLWSAGDGRLLRTLVGHNCYVNAVAFAPDGTRVISGAGSPFTNELAPCQDNTLRLWDVATGNLVRTFTGHTCYVNAVAFLGDGTRVVSGSGNDHNEPCADNTLKIWDVGTGNLVRTIATGYSNKVTSVASSSDGELIVSGGEHKHTLWNGIDNGAKLWDATTGRLLRTFEGSQSGSQAHSALETVPAVALSRDGKLVLAVHWSREVKVWNAGSGELIRTFPQGVEQISSLAASPDGRKIMSGHFGREVFLWDATTAKILQVFRKEEAVFGGALAVAFSPDGTRGLAGLGNDVIIWSIDSGRVLHTLVGHSSWVRSASFAPDGKQVLSSSDDGTVRLWDADNGRLIGQFQGTTFGVPSAVFSHDGSLVFARDGAQAKLLDFRGGKIVHVFEESASSMHSTSLAFSPTDNELLMPTLDNTLRLIDATSGDLIREFGSHGDLVSSVAFSSDGLRVLTGSSDKMVRLWEVATGRQIHAFKGHTGQITSVMFSPDGSRAWSSAEDGTVRIWEVETGKSLVTLVSDRKFGWLVVGDDGRFDGAVDLDQVLRFSWIMPDDADRPLPPEIFMRDYYEPRLLPRLLACRDAEAAGDADACAKAFKPVRPLAELNRVQPDVKILGARRGMSADVALVDVEVSKKEDARQMNGKTRTDVYDLRLFRGGQLVGQWPAPKIGAAGAEDIQGWRQSARLPVPVGANKVVHTFEVRLASRDKGQTATFTAYAFNEDRVKSETASYEGYVVPADIAPRAPRAYVITVGVNAYENPALKLSFAVKDARDLSTALRQIRGYEVVPVSLLSDIAEGGSPVLNQATKVNIRAVLGLLAGDGDSERERLRQILGSQVDKLAKATPDDLVIVVFSGHGHTDFQGRFYLLPSDSGGGRITDALPKLISSEELSEQLRQVDAGEMVLIIDACHSAASVETPGFKPGPMGDRGFGQLAYDKGMRILAATQAADVALESEKIGQGLLTYALVHEGLRSTDDRRPRPADLDGNGVVTMKEWLSYAEKRVPGLYQDIRSGSLRSRDPIPIDRLEKITQYAQTPALFDFSRRTMDVVVQGR